MLYEKLNITITTNNGSNEIIYSNDVPKFINEVREGQYYANKDLVFYVKRI